MTFYSRLESTATRLIGSRGKSAVLVRLTTTGPAHNPVTTPVEHDIKLVETGYSMTNRDTSLVQQGDKLGLISTAGEAPQLSDQIRIDNVLYNFIDVEPLNPGGTTLLYEFHARK